MLKGFRKYFIPILSALLIMSNFSYAVSLSYCYMMKSNTCLCGHEEEEKTYGVTLSEKENPCCDKDVKELSNTASFISNSNETAKFISFQIAVIPSNFSTEFLNNNTHKDFRFYRKYLNIPPTDIPIFTSSLLI